MLTRYHNSISQKSTLQFTVLSLSIIFNVIFFSQKPLRIVITRAGQMTHISLTPKRWSGRGLLGWVQPQSRNSIHTVGFYFGASHFYSENLYLSSNIAKLMLDQVIISAVLSFRCNIVPIQRWSTWQLLNDCHWLYWIFSNRPATDRLITFL